MTNLDAARRFVDFGLTKQAQGERESASGPGSSLTAAESTIWMLDTVVPSLRVLSILDLGCGDWNWMRHIDFARKLNIAESGCSYEGWDAHDGLIGKLRDEFGNERTRFEVADIVEVPFPRVDLIIARDVLFHLRRCQVERVLRKARLSAKFLIANSFAKAQEPYEPREYLGIDGWRFGLLNLDTESFGISKFLLMSVEERGCEHEGERRFLNLYNFW